MSTHDFHARSLATSTALSRYYFPHFISAMEVSRLLHGAGLPFLLVGTHAIGGWINKPRTYGEVEVMVSATQSRSVVQHLQSAFPLLGKQVQGKQTRLQSNEKPAHEIGILAAAKKFFSAAAKDSLKIVIDGQMIPFPSVALALAMTFVGMREAELADRHQHGHVFLCMIEANPEIVFPKLFYFANCLRAEFGEQIVDEVSRIKAGEKLVIQ